MMCTGLTLLLCLGLGAAAAAVGAACTEGWRLEVDGQPLARPVTFYNYTNVKVGQKLVWIFTTDSFTWTAYYLNNFRKREEAGGMKVDEEGREEPTGLRWSRRGQELSWSAKYRPLDALDWTISICQGPSFGFSRADTLGRWSFFLDENEMEPSRTSDQDPEPEELKVSKNKYKLAKYQLGKREKRASEYDTEYPTTLPGEDVVRNATGRARAWYQQVIDFFFGEEDPATGRKDGIITRFVKWLGRIQCSVNGNCPDQGPQGEGGGRPFFTRDASERQMMDVSPEFNQVK